MERKIGEVFEYEGKKLQVKESNRYSCDSCFFKGHCSSYRKNITGECEAVNRGDNKEVIFVDIIDDLKKQPQEQAEQPQKLNLCEILKDCPKGTKFYSTVFGDVSFKKIVDEVYPIAVNCKDNHTECFRADGKVMLNYDGECCLFPSREMRDWSKFTAPWLKKERFDPKTLKPFDRVLAASMADGRWVCDFFSHIGESIRDSGRLYVGTGFGAYDRMIPYNDDTKHLVGTTDEAPEYYRYWED